MRFAASRTSSRPTSDMLDANPRLEASDDLLDVLAKATAPIRVTPEVTRLSMG